MIQAYAENWLNDGHPSAEGPTPRGPRGMEGLIMSLSLASSKTEPSVRINLLETVSLLNKHLTEALCQQAFQSTRTTERQREWSLFALGKFWTAVAIQAPNSFGQALDQARSDSRGCAPDPLRGYPRGETKWH